MSEITLQHRFVLTPPTSATTGEQKGDPNKSINVVGEGVAGELTKMQAVLEYLKALYR